MLAEFLKEMFTTSQPASIEASVDSEGHANTTITGRLVELIPLWVTIGNHLVKTGCPKDLLLNFAKECLGDENN